jgi:hypothetical protein
MTTPNDSSLPSPRSLSRLDLATYLVLRSGAIGLISGSVLGVLFGFSFLAFIWTGIVGAGLGLGLGLVNGLLLSVITCLFFYPLRQVRRYRVIVKVSSAAIAGGGAAVFGPLYFSSTPMTPSSAVLIGFSSILASLIAAWAGGLTGQNIAQWYEQKSGVAHTEPAAMRTSPSPNPSTQVDRYLKALLLSEKSGWISVAFFSLICLFPGNWLLRFLVCGSWNADPFECLPSPRLYTSVIAGFKVTFPIVLLIMLVVMILQNRYKRR